MNVYEKIRDYLGEEEEINEIFRLKKEEAAKKAKAKIKAVADDIQRAIKKHGEDSKTVMFLRAKKKRMQGQVAHAMGESQLDEAKGKDWSAVVSDFQKSLRDAKKSAIPIRDVLKQAGKDFTADRIYLKILKIIRSAEDESKKELAKAFKESFSALKKMREASILEAKGHKWKYQDSRGVWQTGEFLKFSDKGGTDITYFFKRDKTGETDLVSGSRLKKAKKL